MLPASLRLLETLLAACVMVLLVVAASLVSLVGLAVRR